MSKHSAHLQGKARDLRGQEGGSAELRVRCLNVSTESMQHMNKTDPQNKLEAKFSLIYDAAVAWTEGNVSPAAFEDEALRDPRYREIMTRSKITVVEAIAQDEAFAEADLADGRTLEVHVEHARGTTERPMGDEDLKQKFEAGLEIGGFGNASALADLIMTSDDAPVGRMLDILEPGGKAVA